MKRTVENVEQRSKETTQKRGRAVKTVQNHSRSDQRYRTLFEECPIALIEVDPSALQLYFAGLRKRGATDFREYFRSHPKAVHACLRKFKPIDVNAAAVRLYQADSRETFLTNYRRGFVSEPIDGVRDACIAFAEGEESFEYEVVQQDFQGTRKILYLKGALLPPADGSRIRVLISLVDVTPLQRAENDLRTFKAIFDHTQVGTAFGTPDGVLLNVNRSFSQMLGYTHEELVGQHFSRLVHESENEKRTGNFDRLVRDGKLTNLEILHLKKDGTPMPALVNAVVIRNARDEPCYIASSTIDITERKRMEEELKNFKTISDRANICNAIYDPSGHVLYMNRTMAHLTGYRFEEVIGKHYSFFHTDDQMPEVEKKHALCDRTGEVRNVELVYKRKDGSTFPMLLNATMIRDDQGNLQFTALSAIDISERKQMENTLREQEQAVEARNIELEEMNTTLKVLMNSTQENHHQIGKQVVANVEDSAMPLIAGLKNTRLSAEQALFVDALESTLQCIASPFLHNLSAQHKDFSSTELMVMNLVRQGKRTSEIAEMLHLAHRTVDTYRGRIRKKLGIGNRRANLRTQLLTFEPVQVPEWRKNSTEKG